MMNRLLIFFISMLLGHLAISQDVVLEGYVYEEGNRGYLNTARIVIEETATGVIEGETFSNLDGYFSIEVDPNTSYTLHVTKDFFLDTDVNVTTKANEKSFVKIEMMRDKGYMFEITLADKEKNEDNSANGIRNTRIEVYNNTTKEEVLRIDNHTEPEFRIHLEDGNHYTVLIRKDGYFAKKLEAFVNVKGCILCFEGIGNVTPGVADNLTSGNASGVLLANVEMEKVFEGKSLEIENLYYDLDKAYLREDAKKELDKVVALFSYNPRLTIELGSHTDSRGSDEYNMDLSQRRAESAVNYLIKEGGISSDRISSKGYGESRLVNECEDGVTCSEEKHQENRRTELTIVGIDEVIEYEPLVDMKRREELEDLALSGQLSSQQVTGEQLSSILKAEDLEQVPNQDPDDKIVEEGVVETIVKYDKIKDTSNEAKNPTKPNKSVIKPIIVDGPAIVLHETSQRITEDHELYNQHPDLLIFERPNKTIVYYLAGFKDNATAQNKLEELRKEHHPGAFIVHFKNGKIVRD